jgi:tetratricopeptide (TPR) repeat protein
LATSYRNLGNLYSDKGELDKAENYYLKALEIFEKTLPTNHPNLATSYRNLGNLYSDKGELDKAENYYLKALEIFRKRNFIEDYLKALQGYIEVFTKSSNFSLNKLYDTFCEFFVFLFGNQNKLSEIDSINSFKFISEAIVKNQITLDKNYKFFKGVGVCEEFYKNKFFPVYEKIKKELNKTDDLEI